MVLCGPQDVASSPGDIHPGLWELSSVPMGYMSSLLFAEPLCHLPPEDPLHNLLALHPVLFRCCQREIITTVVKVNFLDLIKKPSVSSKTHIKSI